MNQMKRTRSIKYWNLDRGKEYFIQTNDKLQHKFDKMIFYNFDSPGYFDEMGDSHRSLWFVRKGMQYEFYIDDNFYDAEEIRENAQKAREKMEKRALNIILKRIVNEEFQWL